MVLGGKKKFVINGKLRTPIFFQRKVVLLGTTIDNKLTFEAHIEILCKKNITQVYALQRIRKSLTVMQAKVLTSSFANSQFNYCAMLCSRKSKLRLENIHKITLRLVYNEYEKNYKDLLTENNEISIHHDKH